MKIMYQHHHFCTFSIHWVLITMALPKSTGSAWIDWDSALVNWGSAGIIQE
jgi:hypothetical protein